MMNYDVKLSTERLEQIIAWLVQQLPRSFVFVPLSQLGSATARFQSLDNGYWIDSFDNCLSDPLSDQFPVPSPATDLGKGMP